MFSPAFASAPVPATRFLITRCVGAGPDGGTTVGGLEIGPVVGVFAAAVVVSPVFSLVAFPLALTSARSPWFSFPTVIVLLEPLEPQPAISTAMPSVATAGIVRERRGERSLELVTVGQPTGSRTRQRALGSSWTVLGGEVAVP